MSNYYLVIAATLLAVLSVHFRLRQRVYRERLSRDINDKFIRRIGYLDMLSFCCAMACLLCLFYAAESSFEPKQPDVVDSIYEIKN